MANKGKRRREAAQDGGRLHHQMGLHPRMHRLCRRHGQHLALPDNGVSTYGGMTFLIPYIICVALIGSTGVMEEFALGRWAGPVPSARSASARSNASAARSPAASSARCP